MWISRRRLTRVWQNDIILVKNEAFLYASLYTTKGIDVHYHSYVIAPSHGRKLILLLNV